MRKLVLSIAILLGSFATVAAAPSVISLNVITAQEDFKEIKLDEVPESVKTALKAAYPDATLDKAYVNAQKEYKLEITVSDQKATVYADANGNWIKK